MPADSEPEAPPRKRTKKQRRTVVRAACNVCRSRKLACDARRPVCTRCEQQGVTDCLYDTVSTQETRGEALKRELDRLRATLDTVAESLTSLKELPPDAVARLIGDVAQASNPIGALVDTGRRIQVQRKQLETRISALATARAVFPNPASALEFELNIRYPLAYPAFTASEFSFVGNAGAEVPISPSPVPSAGSESSRAPSQHGGTPFQAQITAGESHQLENLNMAYWTNVPISPELTVRAISTYLQTDHPLLCHFDAELFLGDMLSYQSQYCSSFLVNSLLFYCCMKLSSFDKEAAALTEPFHIESEYLLSADETPHMLSLAALGLLYAASAHIGRPKDASMYLTRGIEMGQQLQVWGDTEAFLAWSYNDRRMLSHAAWTMFSHAVFWAFRWWNRVPPEPPHLPIPGEETFHHSATSEFFGVPVSEARRSLRSFNASCTALLVVRDAVVTFSQNVRSAERLFSLSFAESIYRRLLNCNDADGLITRPVAPDYVTVLRMWFHMAVMDIFQPFLRRNETLAGFSASDRTPAAIFMASLRQLQHLVLLYRFRNPLSLTTPLWHGCIFFVAKAVTTINITNESRIVFRLCVSMYADLVVSFPRLVDVFRGMLLLGMQANFVSPQEFTRLVEEIRNRRHVQQALKDADLTFLASLSLNETFVEAAHPRVESEAATTE